MRLLFVIPPPQYNSQGVAIDRVYGCNYGFDYKPPIHHLQLATWARTLGAEVRFLDCPAEGMNARSFEAFARARRFDAAVFHSVYISAEEDLRAARFIRDETRWGRRARFLFWGTAPGWRPERFRVDDATAVLLGEPEAAFADWYAAVRDEVSLEGIAGLGWYGAQGFVRGPARPLLDVTTLPSPDRGLLRGSGYRLNRLGARPITVACFSRGCGWRCTFCTPMALDQSIELEFKRGQQRYVRRPPLRKRTVPQVVAEFRSMAAMGYRAVEVADNMFTDDPARVAEICDAIAPLGLEWTCLGRAPQLADPEVARALARGGCRMVYMGTESFDDEHLKDMKKGMRSKEIYAAVETLRAAGVEPEISVLMGASARETPESVERNIAEARRLGTRFVHYSVVLPTPSTELYDEAKAKGWFVGGEFEPVDNAKDAIVNLPGISAREMRTRVLRAYREQYASPRGMLRQLRQVRGPRDLLHKVRSGVNLLRFSAADRVRPAEAL
ncbi:radical SAM protein [Myxococcota bacterium]|nr:radical SAM protein [Myxococcota bacterium]